VEGKVITIPKVLFPFNEEWLKFALYNKLEEKGINAFLEPKIPVRKTKLVYYDYGGYLAPTWRERLSRLIPDIVIGEPYLQIWEIENFWKDDISQILKHPYEYERILGMRAFAFTWRAKWIDRVLNTTYGERQVRDWIVQADPITGLIKAPKSLYEPGPRPPEDITLECALPGSPEFHSRIQYELAVWLWRKNALVAFEMPISHKGKVYAPDEIVISREEGMIEWKPRGWWSYAIDLAPPTVTVDLVSMINNTISGYEIKSRRELRQAGKSERKIEELIKRTERELLGMVTSGLFNEVFLVLPYEEACVMAEELRKAESLKERAIGVLAYKGPYDFEVIKEAEKIRIESEPKLTIRVVP